MMLQVMQRSYWAGSTVLTRPKTETPAGFIAKQSDHCLRRTMGAVAVEDHSAAVISLR